MLYGIRIKTDNSSEVNSYVNLVKNLFDNKIRLAGQAFATHFELPVDNKEQLKALLLEKQIGQLVIFPKYWARYKKITTPINILLSLFNVRKFKAGRLDINYREPLSKILLDFISHLIIKGYARAYKTSKILNSLNEQYISAPPNIETLTIKLNIGVYYKEQFIIIQNAKGKLLEESLKICASNNLPIDKATLAIKPELGFYIDKEETFEHIVEYTYFKINKSIESMLKNAFFSQNTHAFLTTIIEAGYDVLVDDITNSFSKYEQL